MLKKIDNYILGQIIRPFLGALGITLFVLIMNFLLNILNLIISKGVEIKYVLQLFAYGFSWMLVLAFPMAVLVSILMVFGRMSGDNEIIATKSAGIPITRLMRAPLLFGIMLSLAMFWFSSNIVPEANFQMKRLMHRIYRSKPMVAINPRIFITEFPGIILWVGSTDDRSGKLFDVTIYRLDKFGTPELIKAPTGEVFYDDKNDVVVFKLYRGEIHQTDQSNPSLYTRAEFSEQTITIADFGAKEDVSSTIVRGDRELSLYILAEKINENKEKIRSIIDTMKNAISISIDTIFIPKAKTVVNEHHATVNTLRRARKTLGIINNNLSMIQSIERRNARLRVEFHKKFTLPLACLFFIFVGVPLGAWARKGGISVAVGLSFFIFLLYWVFLIGGEEIADRTLINPAIAMWSGNIVIFIIGLVLLYRITYDVRFGGTGWFYNLISRFTKKKGK